MYYASFTDLKVSKYSNEQTYYTPEKHDFKFKHNSYKAAGKKLLSCEHSCVCMWETFRRNEANTCSAN